VKWVLPKDHYSEEVFDEPEQEQWFFGRDYVKIDHCILIWNELLAIQLMPSEELK